MVAVKMVYARFLKENQKLKTAGVQSIQDSSNVNKLFQLKPAVHSGHWTVCSHFLRTQVITHHCPLLS